MDIATSKRQPPLSTSDFSRIRLFKGENIANIEDLLNDCPVISIGEEQFLADHANPEHSLLILLSGRLEQQQAESGLPSVVTAGDYVGGLNGYMFNSLSGYRAIQDSRLLALDEDMLKSLAMISHSAAVNLSALALEQFKRMSATDEILASIPAPVLAEKPPMVSSEATTSAETLPHGQLHDAKWLEELLDRQIIRCRMGMEAISLAVLEIDGMDIYREKHGDESVPYVSNTVAHTILASVRPGDLVARIDDEHFVVVLPQATLEDSKIPAQRLSTRIAKAVVNIPNDCTLPAVTVSIGIAELKAMIGAEKFVEQGVRALGRAREQGPDSISA